MAIDNTVVCLGMSWKQYLERLAKVAIGLIFTFLPDVVRKIYFEFVKIHS